MEIKVILQKENLLLFEYSNLTRDEIMLMPIKDDIIVFENKKYKVIRIDKYHKKIHDFYGERISINKVNIIVRFGLDLD